MPKRLTSKGQAVRDYLEQLEFPLPRGDAAKIADEFEISRQRIYQLIEEIQASRAANSNWREQQQERLATPKLSVPQAPQGDDSASALSQPDSQPIETAAAMKGPDTLANGTATMLRPLSAQPATARPTSTPGSVIDERDVRLTWVAYGFEGFAAVRPSQMRSLFFISTYKVADPDSPAPGNHGYQCEPMEQRISQIARYFAGLDHRYRTTPIIISVRLTEPAKIDRFVELFNERRWDELHDHFGPAVVSVVDGQHRYRGLVKAHEDAAKRWEVFGPPVPSCSTSDSATPMRPSSSTSSTPPSGSCRRPSSRYPRETLPRRASPSTTNSESGRSPSPSLAMSTLRSSMRTGNPS